MCAYYGETSGPVQSEFVHDGSVKHPYTFSWPPHTAAPTKRPDVQTGGRHAPVQDAAGGGWVAGIDWMSTVLGERRGPTALSLQG